MLGPLPLSPFDQLLGVRFHTINEEEVEAELVVDPARHHQPYGVVHGGVYATLVETLASYGAALSAEPAGLRAVGIENHTHFLRMVGSGTIQAKARALQRGRRLHLWWVECRDQDGRLLASGSCRLMLVDGDAGETGPPLPPPSSEPNQPTTR